VTPLTSTSKIKLSRKRCRTAFRPSSKSMYIVVFGSQDICWVFRRPVFYDERCDGSAQRGPRRSQVAVSPLHKGWGTSKRRGNRGADEVCGGVSFASHGPLSCTFEDMTGGGLLGHTGTSSLTTSQYRGGALAAPAPLVFCCPTGSDSMVPTPLSFVTLSCYRCALFNPQAWMLLTAGTSVS
jgi:hypothetical protein